MGDMTAAVATRAPARRLIAADAAWDLLLGLTVLVVAVPAGAGAIGVPVAGSPVVVAVLIVVGLGSLGYAAVLGRASRRDDSAEAICGPTAIANGVGAIALAGLVVLLWSGLTAVGAGVITLAAVGCGAFAAAEWAMRL